MSSENNNDAVLRSVFGLAEACDFDRRHAEQVAHIALSLFDGLIPLHGLGDEDRFRLHCAALLHDVGRCEGAKRHHKTSLRLIVSALDLPMTNRERLIIGSIARYHRGSPPNHKHNNFAALNPDRRRLVRTLSGMLRAADGLDHSRTAAVSALTCDIKTDEILVRCACTTPNETDIRKGQRKSALLAEVLGRSMTFCRCNTPE